MISNRAFRFHLRVKSLVVVICLLVAAMVSASCSAPRPEGVSCEITSHADGDQVGQYIATSGTTSGMKPEWSMYSYTRAKRPAEPWWLSEKKATVVGDEWSVDVVIGNDTTSSGTEFEVVIVVADGKPTGPTTNDIPDSVLTCDAVNLIRE